MDNNKKETAEQEPQGGKEVATVQQEDLRPAEMRDGQLILTEKHKELIQKQIAPDATKEELDLFFMMAYRTRLDPLLKQLYFIKYKGRDGKPDKVSYVTSIDGYRIIAHRTGEFDGVDEPEYKYQNGRIYSCTVKVYRKGSAHAFSATVKFDEYNAKRNLWLSMPETMIAKVAEAHALRKAFPQDLSGIYTTDEMDQAGQMQRSQGQLRPAPKVSQQKLKIIENLFVLKGKQVQTALDYYGVKKLADLDDRQATGLMKKLNTFPDANQVFETHQEGEVVDPDQADRDINADKAAEGPEKPCGLCGSTDMYHKPGCPDEVH